MRSESKLKTVQTSMTASYMYRLHIMNVTIAPVTIWPLTCNAAVVNMYLAL